MPLLLLLLLPEARDCLEDLPLLLLLLLLLARG
jgi:hypothetical protein